ncbi:hypothetical protein EYF80_011494 [Liparis tanakae]|uniref:Uncharacterized protein n=1 Tax=Liparis tanakae TaxID=230148 RepID=A0A4Z2ILB3_9TELE|nr:hypothetical protein EYF80_011494 [Liparis tanakae]
MSSSSTSWMLRGRWGGVNLQHSNTRGSGCFSAPPELQRPPQEPLLQGERLRGAGGSVQLAELRVRPDQTVDVSDEPPVAAQAAAGRRVGLHEAALARVQLRPAVRDVGDDARQRKPLLGPRGMLVRLVVTVQELERTNKLVEL